MDKLLIVGVDTVVGGNLAAWLALRYQIVGLSLQGNTVDRGQAVLHTVAAG